MHEEILYLRQQLDYSENQVTTMREEIMTEKLEKRKMAEHMRSMAGHRAEQTREGNLSPESSASGARHRFWDG